MNDPTAEQLGDHFMTGVGAVLSADIAVPEHAREVRFYSRVLTTGDTPLWREADLMNNLGMPIIGLGERSGEYAHLPLQWMPHFQVAAVEKSVTRALDLGGRVLMEAGDEWAVLLDPAGAAFGIIPVLPSDAIPMDAAAPPMPAGRIAWADLTVDDAPALRDFYTEVIGWGEEEVEMRDADGTYSDYKMLAAGGRPAAGICHSRGVNRGLPPVWLIYLPVGDLEESLRRVEEEGGEIVRAARAKDGGHAFAVVRDPVGACVALVSA